MSEVKLEDLLEMNAAPAANADPARPDLAPAQVVTAVTQQVEEISPEDRKKIDAQKRQSQTHSLQKFCSVMHNRFVLHKERHNTICTEVIPARYNK